MKHKISDNCLENSNNAVLKHIQSYDNLVQIFNIYEYFIANINKSLLSTPFDVFYDIELFYVNCFVSNAILASHFSTSGLAADNNKYA